MSALIADAKYGGALHSQCNMLAFGYIIVLESMYLHLSSAVSTTVSLLDWVWQSRGILFARGVTDNKTIGL